MPAPLPTPRSFAFSLERGVASIALARPARLNALTFEVYDELARCFEALSEYPEARAVALSGEGRGFCSGGDQDDIIAELFGRDARGLLEFTRLTGRLIAAIRQVRRPVVAGIHGACVGAGAVMAAACDLRVCDPTAKFGFIFPRVGLSGADMGAAYLLPRIVGLGRASEILFFGEIFGADEAYRIGFVNRVVDAGRAPAEARAWAEKLAAGPAFAHAMTKTMLEREHTMSLAEAIEAEAQAQALCMQHPDFLEAHQAWKEKRPPAFEGAPPPEREGGA
ncbi:MAG TPA: enoyl-CoA hydratase family protein [Polyangiaceae bacterium]|nr:enoyl-CoA hydratase family protein [Polyangiaceae bacterium]